MDDPIPEVYVLWHPRCGLGEYLARRIHRWLRPGNGCGPQVYFRSLPSPESPAGGLPPPLPGETRGGGSGEGGGRRLPSLQIVLPLAEENMVADAAWRYWLVQLARQPGIAPARLFAPVALDSTAFNLPAPLNELNFLRPAGLPLAAGVEASEAARSVVTRSLSKQLTETLCQPFLSGRTPGTAGGGRGEDRSAASKIRIFLSHAKVDGTVPAKRLRDYIYSQTQLSAFYDENDIPFGSAFGQVLDSDLEADLTAALIAVRSAQYASRPWCRRELSVFRRPRRVPNRAGTDEVSEYWRLSPMLVVEAIDGGQSSAGIPELGNTPVIRWGADLPGQEEEIVTTIVRDVLLAAYHARLGRAIPRGTDHIVLNWLPDPGSLLQIDRVRAGSEELKIFYPGRGMSGLELATLDELFPRLEFRAFEEVVS